MARMAANRDRERESEQAVFYKDTDFFHDFCSVITKSVLNTLKQKKRSC